MKGKCLNVEIQNMVECQDRNPNQTIEQANSVKVK